jgi:HAD superfamily hydrolase (TIGR01509 family)
MRRPAALLWDVDGTLAETERDGHRVAFNLAFEEAGLPWRWDVARYGELLRVAGGRERLLADLASQPAAPAVPAEREALATAIHERKNHFYGSLAGDGRIRLRPGVEALMDDCRACDIPMGITTTTSRSNLDALLRVHLGPGWRGRFAAVVNGEDVARKKPDPEVYDKAVRDIGVAPGDAVAIEDSPDGVAAARGAGVPVLVARSAYFAAERFDGLLAVGPCLGTTAGWRPAAPEAAADRIHIDTIAAWCERSTEQPPSG